MSIALAIIIIACTTFIGYCVTSKYRTRYRFYNDILILFKSLRQNLNFKKDKLVQVFETEINNIKNKELIELVNLYIVYLKNKEFQNRFNSKLGILTVNENEVIGQIFNSLGHSDILGENKNLDLIDNLIEDSYKNAKEEYFKYNNLYIKLGFFIGCFIVILLI